MGEPTTFVCDDETAENGHLYVDVDDFATIIIRREGGTLACEIHPFGVSTDCPGNFWRPHAHAHQHGRHACGRCPRLSLHPVVSCTVGASDPVFGPMVAEAFGISE